MSNPLVSIIIPVYNSEKYLSQCLDSLVNQTYENLEIICINDGSSDASLTILDEYADKDKRIHVINKRNEGVSIARNAGLEKITGRYLMFVDSDDWLDVTTCEEIVNEISTSDADVLMWGYLREFGDTSRKQGLDYPDKYVFDESECREKLHRRMIGLVGNELKSPEKADILGTVWGKLYRTDVIDKQKIFFEDIRKIGTYEDGIFNLYYFEYVHKAIYLKKYYYHYRRINSESITSRYRPELPEQWRELYRLMEVYIETKGLDNTYRQALQNRIALGVLGLGFNIMEAQRGSINKVKEIKKILSTEQYREASSTLSLEYFPVQWKLFYGCAKKNNALGIYLLLLCMNILRK